jgi:hypothetical protein
MTTSAVFDLSIIVFFIIVVVPLWDTDTRSRLIPTAGGWQARARGAEPEHELGPLLALVGLADFLRCDVARNLQ